LITVILTRDTQTIADKCNDLFTTIGTKLANDIPIVIEKPNDYFDEIKNL